MKGLRLLAAGFALCGTAAADSGIDGPVSGFVLDGRNGAIRPVNGIPGAALLGAPAPIPFEVRAAAVAAGLDYALVAGENGQVMLARALASASPAVTAIPGAIGGVSRMALSENGSAAVLYSANERRMQVVSGLPGEPRAGAPADASALGEVTALAVDDAGKHAFAGTSGAVYSLSGGDVVRVAGAQDVSAIALLNGGRDLAFASKGTDEIVLVRDAVGAASVLIVGSASAGVNRPVGLQPADGGRQLWVANAGSSAALVFNLAVPGAPESVDLPGPPTRCDRLNGRSVLVFNEAGASPLLLVDWARERKVYFVPVD
jgi:hypothetical protein